MWTLSGSVCSFHTLSWGSGGMMVAVALAAVEDSGCRV